MSPRIIFAAVLLVATIATAAAQRLKVGIVQLAQSPTIVASRDRIVTQIAETAARGARVVVLPEEALNGQPGESYIAYTYDHGGPMGVKNLPAGVYDLLWFDTHTGVQVKQASVVVPAGDSMWPKPANLGNEIALYLKRTAGSVRTTSNP